MHYMTHKVFKLIKRVLILMLSVLLKSRRVLTCVCTGRCCQPLEAPAKVLLLTTFHQTSSKRGEQETKSLQQKPKAPKHAGINLRSEGWS